MISQKIVKKAVTIGDNGYFCRFKYHIFFKGKEVLCPKN